MQKKIKDFNIQEFLNIMPLPSPINGGSPPRYEHYSIRISYIFLTYSVTKKNIRYSYAIMLVSGGASPMGGTGGGIIFKNSYILKSLIFYCITLNQI